MIKYISQNKQYMFELKTHNEYLSLIYRKNNNNHWSYPIYIFIDKDFTFALSHFKLEIIAMFIESEYFNYEETPNKNFKFKLTSSTLLSLI